MLVTDFQFIEHQDDKNTPLSYIRVIGSPKGASKILWSCHIDTVHAPEFDNVKSQRIIFDDEDTMLAMSGGNYPLGADNGAGMWLLLEMIAEGVPGTYVFHRGEERGGIGSDGMAVHWADLIKKHTHAIAFDRRGFTDVITHQWGGRCCSERFANQMSTILGMGYAPDDGGSFTDTANYTHLIPECTNISVGYHDEHGPSESLDLTHVVELRAKVIEAFKNPAFDLIVQRKVTDKDDDRWGYGTYGMYGRGYNAHRGSVNFDDYDAPYGSGKYSSPHVYDSEKNKGTGLEGAKYTAGGPTKMIAAPSGSEKGSGGATRDIRAERAERKRLKKLAKQEAKRGAEKDTVPFDYQHDFIDAETLDAGDIVSIPIDVLWSEMRHNADTWSALLFRLAEEVVFLRDLVDSYEASGALDTDPDDVDDTGTGVEAETIDNDHVTPFGPERGIDGEEVDDMDPDRYAG
jgi:hypothetical protein